MNKQLINKYKSEFDHWLNEGKILYKHKVSNAWWNDQPWNYSPDYVTAIIINDEYAEFRKALAEGNTIEYLGQSSNLWQELKNVDFNLHPTCYRIKPDEPKFKVGDFVRCTSTTSDASPLRITRFVQGNYHVLNSNLSFLEHEFEPWTPVKGEWCWFYDNPNRDKYCNLSQFGGESNGRCFKTNCGTPWNFCEPFLNSLPSYLKDK